MNLTLRDYYQFFKLLPLADNQVQFRYKDQAEMFGDQFRRIIYDLDVKGEVDDFVEKIKREFHQVEIRWKVGSTDRPKVDWGSILTQQGFEPAGTEWGMIFDLENIGKLRGLKKRLAPDIKIREISSSELFDDKFVQLRKRNFDRSDEMIEAGLQNYLSLEAKGLRYQHLIAMHEEQWVGHAVLSFTNQADIAFLAGAMTDEQFRERGIYSTMLARRAEHARQMGKKYLVINALSHTSGPILKKVGFQIIGNQEIFSYPGPRQSENL